jgi:multiple sugar transport system substrate-binding protein
MIKRTVIVVLAIAAVTALHVGRSHRGEDRAVTLRLVAWGNEKEEVSLRSLIADFEKAHQNIKVELQITPHARVFDKLMISTAGGRPPDVSRVSSLWFHSCAAKGLFEDLGPYARDDKSFDLTDFYPEAIEGWGKHDGKLYSIPTDIDVYAMYYNRDMFDKYRIPYPDWSWDWKKYLDAARQFTADTNHDGKRDQWGTSTDQFWQDYVFQNGGSVISGDLKRCALTEPAAYEAIQWASDLINKHHVAPNAEESAEVGSLKLFENGKLAMFISGSWAAELQFAKDKIAFNYDVAPLPKGKDRVTFIGGGAYSILRRSEHRKEAWELLKWMTGPEYQRRAAIESQIIPSRRSVAESGAYLKQSKPPASRKVFLDMIQYGRANPAVSVAPEMNEILGAEISLALLGKEPAKTACEKVTPKIDQLLRQQE